MPSYIKYRSYQPSTSPWMGEIPDRWKCVPLKHIASFVNGNVFPPNSWTESGVPIIRIENLNGGEKFNYCDGVVAERHHICRGDLLFGWSGNRGTSFGPFRWKRDGLYYLNQHIFKVLGGECDADWLYWSLRAVTAHVEEMASGIIGMVHITKGELGAIKVCVPTAEEQKAIARFLDFKTAQIDSLIAKKKVLLDKLAEKRTALISHAVTKGLDQSVPMKDSGVPWLGKIPAHWDAKRLKFVVSTFGGGTPNTGKPEYWNGDIPWVSPKDMKCDFIEATEDYLTEVGVAESATKIVPVDSVLIVVRSGILRHTIPVARNAVEVSLNQDMKALVANERLRPGFIHWFISGLQEGLLPIWSKQGCTVESIEMNYMSNTVIPLPPVEEQDAILEKILEITSRVDAQVEKVTAVISSLIEYRSSLIAHAVTGKIDVRGFEVPQAAEGLAS